ncbi:hypothetical protein P8452_33567 [Trifolium repens]|nr:hypothetical protein P8452_33567 [Trifolium repens]
MQNLIAPCTKEDPDYTSFATIFFMLCSPELTALSLKHRVSFFCNGYFIFTFLMLNAHGCACSNDIKIP